MPWGYASCGEAFPGSPSPDSPHTELETLGFGFLSCVIAAEGGMEGHRIGECH